MTFRLFIALLFTALGHQVSAIPFLKNIDISSYEVYKESMRPPNPGDDPVLVSDYQFTIDITASVSETEALLFDEDTPVSIRVGDFSWDSTLGTDENFDSTMPGQNRSAKFDFRVFDINTEEFQFGRITLNWSSLTSIVLHVTFDTTSPDDGAHYFDALSQPDFTLWAYRNAIGDAPNPDVSEIDTAEISFGPYIQPSLVYYSQGNSRVVGDDSLIEVTLYGGTDSLFPTSTITQPALPSSGGGSFRVYFVPTLQFSGTVRDTYRVGTAASGRSTYQNIAAPTLKYFLSDSDTLPANAAWKTAIVDSSPDTNGLWGWHSLSDEPLLAGFNYLFTQVSDSEGNTPDITYRKFKYSTSGALTVAGKATGFAPSSTVIGTVKGAGSTFPNPKTINVKADGSSTPGFDTRNTVEGGTLASAIAKPAAGAIFNGWTAMVENVALTLDPLESGKEHIAFLTRPKMTVTGNFIPNPFLAAGVGTYFGITSGSTPSNRGTFEGKVTSNGAFTGKLTLGALTLPVKGKFLGSGQWTGVVTKKGVTYRVTLNAPILPTVAQTITGTIVGGTLNATVLADLSPWRKKTHEAGAYVGIYNVLLPATAGTVPEGIGFGQIKIAKLGKVKFAGKAGDGTALSFSSTLFERAGTGVVFPFYASLSKKLGNISGTVTHDATQQNTDLSGTLLWTRPATTKVEPASIDGQITLQGSKYTPPPKGTRLMLATDGAGALTIRGPALVAPQTGSTAFLAGSVVLSTNQAVTNIIDSPTIQKVSMAFTPSSGLFSGKFYDPAMKKTYSFGGAATQKANGGNGSAAGVFVRGNRAGYVTLNPPAP